VDENFLYLIKRIKETNGNWLDIAVGPHALQTQRKGTKSKVTWFWKQHMHLC